MFCRSNGSNPLSHNLETRFFFFLFFLPPFFYFFYFFFLFSPPWKSPPLKSSIQVDEKQGLLLYVTCTYVLDVIRHYENFFSLPVGRGSPKVKIRHYLTNGFVSRPVNERSGEGLGLLFSTPPVPPSQPPRQVFNKFGN